MRVLFIFIFSFLAFMLNAKTYYVADGGNDSGNGESIASPFKTITKAVSLVLPGDIIYVRGGTYNYNSTINITRSGTVTDSCFLLAYPGERPVLDFSATAFGKRGVSLTGSYWHIKGFDMIKAGDNGLYISGGGHNIIEFCSFIENKDSGLQLSGGTHDNKIINCDSYYNADPTDYGDADGFACKMDVGSNNSFYGCRSWLNVDDGWDGYLRGADNVSTTLENCWTWQNGYFKDGTDAGANANGNGFKMGGSDDKLLIHNFTLRNCVAFDNKAKGFDQNNNKGSMIIYNGSAYRNNGNNYSVSAALAAGKILEVKNCLSADAKISLGSFAIQQTNSWLAPFYVTSADFISLDTTGVSAPRKADGSLPDIEFLHLASGSDLIDAGTNIGLKYFGQAPDLGAFESGTTNSPEIFTDLNNIYLSDGKLFIQLPEIHQSEADCRIYNIYGQKVFETLVHPESDFVNIQSVNKGIYLVEISAGERRIIKKVLY